MKDKTEAEIIVALTKSRDELFYDLVKMKEYCLQLLRKEPVIEDDIIALTIKVGVAQMYIKHPSLFKSDTE